MMAQLSLPADCDPKVRQFAEYWLRIHPENGFPGRQHIDPGEIRTLLPNVWLIDCQRNPWRFRFRLVGTRLVEYYGWDPTGWWMDEAFENFNESESDRYIRGVFETGQPHWRRGKPLFVHGKDFLYLERVYLPLAANGRDIDMLFCLTVFTDEERRQH